VTQRKWDDDAVGVDAPPALGEVPQSQQQAVVDSLVVRDRQSDGEVVGSPRAAVEELEPELWPGDDPRHEGVVEDCQPGRFERRPADLGLHVGALLVPAPGPHDVAVADQLHAVPAEHVDRAAEQAVDDQEAAMVLGRLVRRRGVPFAG
jgi:hypothetical protein